MILDAATDRAEQDERRSSYETSEGPVTRAICGDVREVDGVQVQTEASQSRRSTMDGRDVFCI